MKNSFVIVFLLLSNLGCSQDQPIGQIPFAINGDGLMVVSLQINGKVISDFVLDTGDSGTVIDKEVASQMNLPLHDGVFQSIGVNGAVSDRRRTQGQLITINESIVLEELEMTVVDLSHLSDINGLIGFDLFRRFVTETNFDANVISFYKRKGKPNKDGYKAMPFVESFCTPEIDISVLLPNDELCTGKVFFDTGNTSTPLTINSPFVNSHNLTSKFDKLITSESRGINAISKSHKGVAKSIEIIDFKLSDIPIALAGTGQGMLSKEGYMGNLGLELISKFNFILDYNKKQIYLKPNASYRRAFEFPVSGIELETKDKGIYIRNVSEPSVAYDKGLRAGQQLISIDGIEGRVVSYYEDALEKENEKVTIVVKLEDGTFKTVEVLLNRLI